jgi:3-hydroxyacyl-CoA dehydrogenase / enoyl-CoA hydratase / 3-hydroxybutyryl-CoA epimerase
MLVKQVARKARKAHYPAPYALIETWRRSGGGGVQRCWRRAPRRWPSSPARRPRATWSGVLPAGAAEGLGGKEHGIERVHVVGAGVMGGDIAAWCALRGFEVTLQDRESEVHRAGARTRGHAVREEDQGPGTSAPRRPRGCAPTSRATAWPMPTW